VPSLGRFIATAPAAWDSAVGIGCFACIPSSAPRKGAAMLVFDMLAWGFVGFTALLCAGVGWLWWQERHTERP